MMVVLVGFTGAGKSTVGQLLAQRLGHTFVDSDVLLQQRLGPSVREVLDAEGEPYLRDLEHRTVAELVHGPDAVIALGGGALTDPRTRAVLRDAHVVHLRVSYDEARSRVGDDAASPMLSRPDLADVYRERAPVYAAAATLVVDTDGRGPDSVAAEVLARLSHPDVGGAPDTARGRVDAGTWLAWSRELHSIAQAGLTYAENGYDLLRYARLREIAADVTAALADAPPDPVRMAILGETGYLTPKIDVRAAVHDDAGRVLMVREVVDGRWTLPGGWADVNEGLIEGACREVREESGYVVEGVRLLGIYDKGRWGAPANPLFTLTVMVACRLVGGEATTSYETDAVDWYARDAVPPLSEGRTPPALLARVFEHFDDPTLPQDLI